MLKSSPVSVKEAAANRSACGVGLFFARLENWTIALVAGLMPVCFCLAILGFTGLALWHSHRTVMTINFGSFGVKDGLYVVAVVAEVAATVLLVRQLATPRVPAPVRMELLQGDQPELFEVIRLVSEKVRAPMPEKVVVDGTAGIGADYDRCLDLIRARKLRMNLGLCLVVGVTTAELVGLMAHELAFFTGGSGSRAARFVRGVHRWFSLRIKHDPWMDWLDERAATPKRLKRWFFRSLQGIVWLSLRPLRILFALCRLFTEGMMKAVVTRADACAARLVGSQVMAGALDRKRLLMVLGDRAHAEYLGTTTSLRLPDSLPLLISRRLMIDHVSEEEMPVSSHWQEIAPSDEKRRALILKLRAEGMIEAVGDATALFRNFHELARRGTYFHYQNTHGLAINDHRFVAVEETVHDGRASMEIIEVLNQYYRGLAHPERAFCGIAEEHTANCDVEALHMELQDCREWLEKYGERMAAALTEWSKTWRLVRDLQTAYVLSRASIPVNRGQFSVTGSAPESYLEEIERQRHIMDTMEGVLRQYEGKLETRIAASLELFYRADPRTLAPALAQTRDTLPHWVLVYEALGLNLPVLRELMTQFHAFQSLGATVSGLVSSASYAMTLQALMPDITRLLQDILSTISDWPYPFHAADSNQVVTLAEYLAPNASILSVPDSFNAADAAQTDGNHMVLIQVRAKRVCEVVAPFIDNYLALYHQAFAWISKASELAESLLYNPFEAERQRVNPSPNKSKLGTDHVSLAFAGAGDPELAHSDSTRALAA